MTRFDLMAFSTPLMISDAGFVPTHVLEHHHAGEDDAARIDLVEIGVLGRRAVRRLEYGDAVANVAAGRDARARRPVPRRRRTDSRR